MKILAFALIIPFCVVCCVSTQPAESVAETPEEFPQCPLGEFSGFGIGNTENEALSIARSDLAKQISLSVKVTAEYAVNRQSFNGGENLSTKYETEIREEAALANAQDARVAYKKYSGNKARILVCMSKTDAAKGFLERQRLAADSLEMISGKASIEKHPKLKNAAWNKTQTLWNKFMNIQNLLKDWGIESKHFDYANESYTKIRENYKSYCQGMKVFWEDSEDECSNASFAIFSKKAKIEKSQCSDGLKLRFVCAEKCKQVSFGIECSFEPSLAIESCDGEKYSLLRAKEPVTGSDMYNKNKAMENLIDNLPKAAFFNEWENEIKEWVPQCAE